MANTRDSGDKVLDWQELKEMFQGLLEPPVFSGKDPEEWLQRIETYFWLNRTPPNQRFSVVQKSMDASLSGKYWFELIYEIFPCLTWSEFKKHFRERFGSSEILIKEEETEEVMKSGPGLKHEETNDDGVKKNIVDVTSDSSMVLSSGNHQEISSDRVQVQQAEQLIHQGEENKMLLLLPTMSLFRGVPEVKSDFLGHQNFQKLGVKASCLLEMALYRQWNSVTYIPPISFYIDTGQNHCSWVHEDDKLTPFKSAVCGLGSQKVEENRQELMLDIFSAGKKEGKAAVKEWGFLVSAKLKLQVESKQIIVQKETTKVGDKSYWAAALKYGQQHNVVVERRGPKDAHKASELYWHMIMMMWHKVTPLEIWVGPFNNMGQETQQKKGVEQWLCKEITASNKVLTNQSSSVFYTNNFIRLAPQLLKESAERWLGFWDEKFDFFSVKFLAFVFKESLEEKEVLAEEMGSLRIQDIEPYEIREFKSFEWGFLFDPGKAALIKPTSTSELLCFQKFILFLKWVKFSKLSCGGGCSRSGGIGLALYLFDEMSTRNESSRNHMMSTFDRALGLVLNAENQFWVFTEISDAKKINFRFGLGLFGRFSSPDLGDCILGISVSLWPTSGSRFQWLIAWKIGLTRKLVFRVVDFSEDCWSGMRFFFWVESSFNK